MVEPVLSQSLSGWDGVFHSSKDTAGDKVPHIFGRNPFQGGMGFFTEGKMAVQKVKVVRSQSLSGWDGVFHLCPSPCWGWASGSVAIPFRVGWGFSLGHGAGVPEAIPLRVAIPFRVGWGFSPEAHHTMVGQSERGSQSLSGWDGVFHLRRNPFVELATIASRRNPFQGGMGFFTLWPRWLENRAV